MNSSGAPLIKLEKLIIVFNVGKPNEVRVLDTLDLDIYPHEYLILFGPSGCGKSTLLNVISGLLPPTSGKVEVEGKEITTFTEKEKLEVHRRRIGMIFQSIFLVPTLSIIDNVCLPRSFAGDDSPASRQDAMNFLKRFGIEAQAEKFPNDLSGGQRQRVAIARALMNSPSIIVADEPVGNLDSKATYNVLSILKDLNEIEKFVSKTLNDTTKNISLKVKIKENQLRPPVTVVFLLAIFYFLPRQTVGRAGAGPPAGKDMACSGERKV